MKFLVDFLPIIVFFVVYKFYGIYAATASAIAISFLQVGYTWLRTRKFEKMQVATLLIITVLGGATLLLHNEMFIKWKPTAINWVFALVFLISHFVGRKNLTQAVLDKNVKLPQSVWARLNLSWVAFFVIVGAVNIYVVYHYSTNTWVNFKLFGVLGLTVIFVIIQAIYLAKHIDTSDDSKETSEISKNKEH